MKLTVEKLPVVIGVSIGLAELLEQGLVTGDWLYRAVPFALVRGPLPTAQGGSVCSCSPGSGGGEDKDESSTARGKSPRRSVMRILTAASPFL